MCERERIQVWERERHTHRSGREIETGVREKERDRGGWEIGKDKKRFRVGGRKIGRETGVVQREREKKRKKR